MPGLFVRGIMVPAKNESSKQGVLCCAKTELYTIIWCTREGPNARHFACTQTGKAQKGA
jgi:hypothetical protein